MFEFLQEPFMQYAVILGILLAASSAFLSPFLVLNNQSMIADGLSHVAFSGIIFGLLFLNQPIYFAIPFTAIAAILITWLSEQKMIQNDSAIAVITAFFLAIGLITVNVSSGFNISIDTLLTGDILLSSKDNVYIAAILFIVVFIFIILNYRKLLSSTYDPTFAKVSKVKHSLLKYCLAILTAIFVTIGLRIAGMLLISAFLVFPALIASQFAKSFKQTLIYGFIIVVLFSFIAIGISYEFDIPTGATIVVIYTIVLALSIIYNRFFHKTN
ncbi:MAG TPA: metal ABC transporter permease [Acholeplasmataceae bacterium]|nr:metal ABC transporter permease [Acholeplasmataceae bacterium]